VLERAATRYEVDDEGCWISTYSTANHGYAQVGWTVDKRPFVVLAHRAAWEYANGPIPDGMTVDHLCFERRCVNPVHMRLITRAANGARHGRRWPRVLGECGHMVPQYSAPHTKPRCRRCERTAAV
jgi:hypothetical protein